MRITQPPWIVSPKSRYMSIAAPEAFGLDPDDAEYYGGELICESVRNPADRALICAAPELAEALMCATAKQRCITGVARRPHFICRYSECERCRNIKLLVKAGRISTCWTSREWGE
jgi:hypothetical protein